MNDLSNATYDELLALHNDVIAERQKREKNQALLDSAWAMALAAKGAGIERSVVIKEVTKVVTEAYGTIQKEEDPVVIPNKEGEVIK